MTEKGVRPSTSCPIGPNHATPTFDASATQAAAKRALYVPRHREHASIRAIAAIGIRMAE